MRKKKISPDSTQACGGKHSPNDQMQLDIRKTRAEWRRGEGFPFNVFPTSLCGVLVFDSVPARLRPASVPPSSCLLRRPLFVTHHLSHTTLPHTIFHIQLCHTPSFTQLSHTHTIFHTTFTLTHTQTQTHTHTLWDM